MKKNSHKIILTVICVFLLSFSIYAGEGQCPAAPPTGGLTIQQDNLQMKNSAEPPSTQGTSSGNNISTEFEEYLDYLMDFISGYSM